MEILGTRSLEAAVRGRPVGSVGKIREVHHFVAQAYAAGMKPPEIAQLVNRTAATVRNWLNAPANAELVAQYAKEHFQALANEAERRLAVKRRLAAMADEEILDRLEADAGQFNNRELIALSADASDRTGLGKTETKVNLNVDVGTRLDKAKAERLKVIDGRTGEIVKFIRRF